MSTEILTDVAVRTEDIWKIYAQEPEDVEAVPDQVINLDDVADFVACLLT